MNPSSANKPAKTTKDAAQKADQCPTQRVLGIVEELSMAMQEAIGEIREINENAKLLSLNARIEAARAGSSGAAFGVVAQEMQALSGKTATVADEMANKTTSSIGDLVKIIGGNVRGTRLADQALTNIDLVDRCLYERTCDVRWWASDSAIVQGLTTRSTADLQFAAQRMGVILNAYTVYHDLVLCDLEGAVVANGKPNENRIVGRNESRAHWFSKSMSLASGDQFVANPPQDSGLIDGKQVAIYATAVRANGESRGTPLGVLGVIFNWESLADAILNSKTFDNRTKRLFLDASGSTLAASSNVPRGYKFPVQKYDALFQSPRDYILDELDGESVCIAHAISPGFETYSSGWHSVLIQSIS
jgi:hypothetical protein